MNLFRKLSRKLDCDKEISKFNEPEEPLDPNRIANRVIYGTDYHPDDVSFQYYKVLNHYFSKVMDDLYLDDKFSYVYVDDNIVNEFNKSKHVWSHGKLTFLHE